MIFGVSHPMQIFARGVVSVDPSVESGKEVGVKFTIHIRRIGESPCDATSEETGVVCRIAFSSGYWI